MNKSTTLRRVLLAPASLRSSIAVHQAIRPAIVSQKGYASLSVAQPSFWKSMIPKPFRKDPAAIRSPKKPKSKEWNPATFFIFIFLLIGSMSIQMIALRNEFTAFTRRADAKIGLLKEIIGRIQNGEDVDVEGLLGAGDAKREQEWEEVLQEIEREDQAWEQSQVSKSEQASKAAANKHATVVSQDAGKQPKQDGSSTPSGFY